MAQFLGIWPNGDVILSFGMTKRQLQMQLDEAADPGECRLHDLPQHGLFEFTQPKRAVAHRTAKDFVIVPTFGSILPRDAPFADVTLVSSDGAEVTAHKVVLSIRAPGLAASISGEQPRVSVPLSGTALSLWLDAIYEDATRLGKPSRPDFYGGRRPDIELGSTCDDTVAVELLEFAHAHADVRLLALCEERLAMSAREIGKARDGWPCSSHFGDGPRPPPSEAEEEARQGSVERLLVLAERAVGSGAAQLLEVVKHQLVRQVENVIAVCQRPDGGAALRQRMSQACGQNFVHCLAYEANKSLQVKRTVWNNMGGGRGVSVPLSAYLEAGGQLRPGDPVPGTFASRSDRELGGGGRGTRVPPKAVRDRELNGYVLRGFDERLGAGGVAPSRLVTLELNMAPPYELARKTITSVSRAILPRMTKAALDVTAGDESRECESYPGEFCLGFESDDTEVSASARQQLAEAYLADICNVEQHEAKDKVEADMLVRSEQGDAAATAGLSSDNTAGLYGSFAEAQGARMGQLFGARTPFGAADPAGGAGSSDKLELGSYVFLNGLNRTELNGQCGYVLGVDSSTGRYKVQLESGPAIKVKGENLVAVDDDEEEDEEESD